MKYVYLAGPIEGCTQEEINLWRDNAQQMFSEGVLGVSPTKLDSRYSSAIITQNYMDTTKCDVVLAYLPRCISDRRCSYGTVCEIAWAYAHQTPVVIVSDDEFVHKHPLLDVAGAHFTELEEAIDYINILLGEYDRTSWKRGLDWDIMAQ